MNTRRYLDRIGFGGEVRHDVDTLEALQRAHLTAVPFENLHVYHRRGVGTSAAWSVPKVVDRGRGGWCFELNGAFASLLESLGFEVRRFAATVLIDGVTDREPAHLTLEVSLDRPYLVDVGFGDSFILPLPLDAPGSHDAGIGTYVLDVDGPTTTMSELSTHGDTAPLYRFERDPVEMEFFDAASQRLQSAPGLSWTAHPFATRLVDGGPDRVTLLHDRLRLRRDGVWTETPVAAEDWGEMLCTWFGMTP